VASIQFGIPYTYLMFSYTRKMQDKKKKFRAAIKVDSSPPQKKKKITTKR
jgi:hypothetical protein